MPIQSITITNSIPLPKEFRTNWRNKAAVIQVFGDTIVIKKVEPPTWEMLLPKLRKAGKRLSPKIVQEAVVWARRNG